MSVALSEHLPLLAIAPDGIKKLRGLILELAMRGKLVSQDPNDDPAKELLIRIAAERSRLVGSGVCKKARSFPPVSEHDCPFQVPQGWLWVRLDEIGHDWGQQVPNSTFTYLDVSAIDNALGRINSPDVLCPEDAPSRARKIVKRGTVIYSTVRPYLLNIAVVDHDLTPSPIASTAFAVIHPLAGISSQFLFWYLRSPVFVRYVESVQNGIAYPAVNDSQFFSGLFPLAPISEQHRIVAKVDELMAICDRLDAEQSDAESAHAQLVEALLSTLTQSTDAADLASNWKRIAEHFDTLFTTESSIEKLRQTALQLAVTGKLVRQDRNDEPADELLRQIVDERERLMADRSQRKTKLPPIASINESPFTLPEGWAWARFPELGSFGRGKSKHRPRNDPALFNPGIYPLIQTGEVARAGETVREYHSRYSEVGLSQSKMWPKGTLCITIAANIADSALLGFDACFPDSVVGFVPSEVIGDSRYFLWFMKTARQELLRFAPSTAQKNINLEILEAVQIPLPPLAEQRRIVAKVDELMALCDRMKEYLREARGQQSLLADTLISAA